METLQEFLAKRNEIEGIVNRIGASGASGVNTFTDRIGYLKERIEKNDYTYTVFHSLFDEFNKKRLTNEEVAGLEKSFKEFMQELPAIEEKINFNFVDTFKQLVERDDFIDQWNSLNEDQKSDLLYLDKEVYKNLRTKLDLKEFDFLFKVDNQDTFDGSYPIDIYEWINASSKTKFYQLRKAAQGGIHEEFFNSQKVKEAEELNSGTRNQIAIKYLINRNRVEDTNICWYNRLDILNVRSVPLHYTYHFFKDLEDELNGYKEIKEKVQLPDILRKWIGQFFDMELYEQESRLLQKEQEGKSPEESNEIYRNRAIKYPTIVLAESIQRELKKEEFNALVIESKGTDFEDFFNNPITEKMCHNMPYLREDYMFVYFRDKFTSENAVSKKPKLR
jgi:hypothetical protein